MLTTRPLIKVHSNDCHRKPFKLMSSFSSSLLSFPLLSFPLLSFPLLSFVVVFSSCVTTHVGQERSLENSHLVVSCAEDREFELDYYAHVSCTFENKNPDWLDVQISELKTGVANDQFAMMSASDIEQFVQSYNDMKKKDEHNERVGVMAVALVGLTAAIAGGVENSPAVAGAGLGVMTGSELYGAGKQISRAHGKIQYGKLQYSDAHALSAEGFRVPGGMFVRKSILFEIKSANVPKDIEFCFSKPEKSCQKIAVKWQSSYTRSGR